MGPDITNDCDFCGGSGEKQGTTGDPPEPIIIECPKCKGSGQLTIGSFENTDVRDGQDDILDKCADILEKLNE